MRTVQIELGEKPYEIRPLPIRKAKGWRKALSEPTQEIANLFSQNGTIDLDVSAMLQTDITELVPFFMSLVETTNFALDEIPELLFSYSPVLDEDKDYILDNASEEQAILAFMEVLKLAYPFGSLVQPRSTRNGQAEPTT